MFVKRILFLVLFILLLVSNSFGNEIMLKLNELYSGTKTENFLDKSCQAALVDVSNEYAQGHQKEFINGFCELLKKDGRNTESRAIENYVIEQRGSTTGRNI